MFKVTLTNKIGSFSVLIPKDQFLSIDMLGYHGLVELKKQNKPVSIYDTVSIQALK